MKIISPRGHKDYYDYLSGILAKMRRLSLIDDSLRYLPVLICHILQSYDLKRMCLCMRRSFTHGEGFISLWKDILLVPNFTACWK